MNIQKLYISATDLTPYVKECIMDAIGRAGLASIAKDATDGGPGAEWLTGYIEVTISGEAEKFTALLLELIKENREIIVSDISGPYIDLEMDENSLWVELYNDHRE